MCGIVGIFRHEGQVSAELYEGLGLTQAFARASC